MNFFYDNLTIFFYLQIDALQEVLEKLRSKEMPLEKKLGWLPSVCTPKHYKTAYFGTGEGVTLSTNVDPIFVIFSEFKMSRNMIFGDVICGLSEHTRQWFCLNFIISF